MHFVKCELDIVIIPVSCGVFPFARRVFLDGDTERTSSVVEVRSSFIVVRVGAMCLSSRAFLDCHTSWAPKCVTRAGSSKAYIAYSYNCKQL